MEMSKRFAAEFIGTFWLVLGGCGSAVMALSYSGVGIGILGVACAFGLSVLTMAYALGNISGAHFNPAVSVGLAVAGRFKSSDLVPYIIAQVLGAIAAAALLYLIASGKTGFDPANRLGANGYGEFSPGNYSATSAFITEVVMTFMFLVVILGATDKRVPAGFAPIAIGLALTLVHLISLPVTATSVNPARSTGPAVVAGGAALAQLWMFWVAPLAGGVLAGLCYRWLSSGTTSPAVTAASASR